MGEAPAAGSFRPVNEQIRRYELLLTSETLRNRDEIQSLISSYEKTAERLREAYESEWTPGGDLPEYSKLVSNR